MIKRFLLNRLGEVSTYKGIIALLGVFGVAIAPDQAEAIITVCIGVYGLLSTFLPNYFGKKQLVLAPAGSTVIETRPELVQEKQLQAPEIDALGDGDVRTPADPVREFGGVRAGASQTPADLIRKLDERTSVKPSHIDGQFL